MEADVPKRKRPRMAYTASAAAETEADEASQRLPNAFVAYYAAQALCSVSAWEETLQLLRRPLLLSVRVNQTVTGRGAAVAPLRSLLHDSLKAVPWLPAAFIVQDDAVQHAVRCADPLGELPPQRPPSSAADVNGGAGGGAVGERTYTLDQAVQHALIMGMKSGELAQQELTSMVPAVLLAPEPQHTVLDMCAAPGSKTTQLLDMMGDDPSGLLICNERDASRMQKLAARMQRQPCSPVLVTCCEAQVRASLPRWPRTTRQPPVPTPHTCTAPQPLARRTPPPPPPPLHLPSTSPPSRFAEAAGAPRDGEPCGRGGAKLPEAQV